MGLLDGVRGYFATRAFMRTPLAQAIRQETQAYFYGNSILTHFADETKQKLIGGMTQQLSAALQSENPVMAIREGLVSFTIQYAQLQVLALTEMEKTDAFYSASPYISGALHHHIEAAAEQVEEVARYKWEQWEEADGPDELIAFCNGRCAIYGYYMNSFNIARIELGDKTDPDWFRPLVEAQMVYEENTIRDKLGLPLTVKDMIEALAYSVMFNYAADGVQAPFYEWCKTWPDKYLAGRGPLPA